MLYIRNIFKQDLTDGKQIAFTTEPSNLFFRFSFSDQNPPRLISFRFKEEDQASPFYSYNGKIINTRLYSARSESRIDGELKQFLRDDLKANVDDVVVFRVLSKESYEFEFVPAGAPSHNTYKSILNGRNHEVAIEQSVDDGTTSILTRNVDPSVPTEPADFDFNLFRKNAQEANLTFTSQLILRFIASLTSKPFVILSGLSGSGKTKIAQSFVQWICESPSQFEIVPVGADWTNREPMVGYPNGLVSDEYITPDSGVIHLFLQAVKKENVNKPFFLILDEMNLSHVERYFADFLSIMESEDTIKLYTGTERKSLDGLPIPKEIGWPENVFIIGTVNIDETTYMFSPKVLDRANVIEFRVTTEEIAGFLANPGKPDLQQLKAQGAAMGGGFLALTQNKESVNNEALTKELVAFFNQLQHVGAEFGYRSASEIMVLVSQLKTLNPAITDDECFDISVMQKLLPKLHGSRSKLVPVLKALAALCADGISADEFEKTFDELYKKEFAGVDLRYPISFDKLMRMYKNVLANGFTSYAEA